MPLGLPVRFARRTPGRAADPPCAVGGYSYDEIAAQLEVSWLTVNRQLVRARAAARAARGTAR
jgi:hypothetical protein